MKLSKAEREEAINKLKDSTAIAKYAFYDALKKNKITDEQLLTMVEYSEIMGMLKPVISANRTGQKNRTRAANIKTEKAEKELATLRQKFEDFKNIENSEILKLGKWLGNAFSLTGQNRKTELAKKNLVHIQDYQNDVGDLVSTVKEHHKIADEQLQENEKTILNLQNTIDNQTKVLLAQKDREITEKNLIIKITQEEVIQEFGINAWNKIWLKIQRRGDIDEAS